MSKSMDDGDPAFPGKTREGYSVPGMSLRDWFAGQALPGVLVARSSGARPLTDRELTELFGPTKDDIREEQIFAALAYALADAMIERSKRRG